MARKNTECTNAFLFKWYKGSKYHVADKGGRFYLCNCFQSSCFEERCGIRPGYRKIKHTPKRNDSVMLDL